MEYLDCVLNLFRFKCLSLLLSLRFIMKTLYLVLSFLFLGSHIFGQPGSLNASFNSTDNCLFGPHNGFNGNIKTSCLQPDGKLIVGGNFTYFNGDSRIRIIRINQDGSVDDTFDPFDGFNYAVETIVLQPDGKILVGGYFQLFDNENVHRIVRLNNNGTLDLTFNYAPAFNDGVIDMTLQPDGKVVLVGVFTTFNGTLVNRIARLTSSGTLDPTFGTTTNFNSGVSIVALQQDGKFIVSGSFTQFNGIPVGNIVRLNSDGSLDPTFNSGSGFDWSAEAIEILDDGDIIATGNFSSYNGSNVNRIARLNSDGSVDSGFNTSTGFNSAPNCLEIQPDGKIIVGGGFVSYNGIPVNRIARLFPDGTIDLSFNIGNGLNDYCTSINLQDDGKIIVLGNFTQFDGMTRNNILRLNPDGAIDIPYNKGSGFNASVIDITLQSDQKILVGGSFTLYNGVVRNYFARLNTDGTLDDTFLGSSLGPNGDVNAILIQPDDKIILAGSFSTFNGVLTKRIIRLNVDGSVDPTFNTGSGFNDFVTNVIIQPDGKLIAIGNFTYYNGTSVNRIVRLNSDGSIDPSFNIGSGFNNQPGAIALQPDEKILVGGNFTSYDGSPAYRMIRLNTDGSVDLSFDIGFGFSSSVASISIQSDNKIIVGGSFTSYDVLTDAFRIIRLNPDGSMDGSFVNGTGFNNAVNVTRVRDDGKIIIGGAFNSYDNVAQNRLVLLNSDGSIDNSFSIGSGFNDIIRDIAIQDDGKIIAGGAFITFNGICRHNIVRLHDNTCNNTASVINIDTCYDYTINSLTYNTSGTYTQIIPNSVGCDSTITINLSLVNTSDQTVNQSYNILTAMQTTGSFQWLDCNSGYAPLVGETSNILVATTSGTFALEININGCLIDTSNCIDITNQDFYDNPSYQLMQGEVFALPVTSIDTCDGIAFSNLNGGVPPYEYDWFTQANNQNSDILDSLCEGSHILKITDNIGDTVLVDYWVTDTANFFTWYDSTLNFVDTIFIQGSNCLIDYSLPLDSANITQLSFISMDSIPPGELYFIEVTYYQAGMTYVHQDTISMDADGWYLIYFSVYCPSKSFNSIKSMLFTLEFPKILELTNQGNTMNLNLFPNPTNDQITISELPENGSILITNLLGEQLFMRQISSTKETIDLSSFPDGTYFIHVKNENLYFCELIIKN